ncbi:MAG: ROK family protein [Peptoniphilaceae bacterium]|nr:ROK family protein [Peptoniphilaceae bacterium]MDY6018869.1 ROK family protein [Anaerococcus sp.]
MYGSIELGGTKIRCAVFSEDGKIEEETRIETDKPYDNVKEIGKFFKTKEIKSLGVGAFGPLDTNKNSQTYGFVKNTPKKYWTNFDIRGELKKAVKVDLDFTSDVAASLIGEYYLGAGKKYRSALYITVGTGIGASYIQDGNILDGFGAPEMGHIKVDRIKGDKVKSVCQYHDDCLEGLASGPSIYNRTLCSGESLDISDQAFSYVATYLAQGLATYSYILRPEVIIMGGGVLNKEGMLDLVKTEFDRIKEFQINNYLDLPDTDYYIVLPDLGNEAGLYGGYLMAKNISEN